MHLYVLLIVPFFSPLFFLPSLSLAFSLLFVAFSSCHIICPVYGHVLLICSILPVPLGFTANIGCCVQKTNGSVSSGPGKTIQRCRRTTDTHTHTHTCGSFTRLAVVHVSVISPLLSPHLLWPLLTLLLCHVLCKLCVSCSSLNVAETKSVLFYNRSTHNFSPRCFIIFGLIPSRWDHSGGFTCCCSRLCFCPAAPLHPLYRLGLRTLDRLLCVTQVTNLEI